MDKANRAAEIIDGTSYNTELCKDEHDRSNTTDQTRQIKHDRSNTQKFLCAFWASQQSIVGENLEECNADTSLLASRAYLHARGSGCHLERQAIDSRLAVDRWAYVL